MPLQQVLVLPVRLAHETPQMVSVHGALEERLRSPDEYLGILFRRLIRYPQRPCYKPLTLFVESGDAQLAA